MGLWTLVSYVFTGMGAAEQPDRHASQTDGYMMSTDGRKRKNLSGDSFVYGDDDQGSILRDAVSAENFSDKIFTLIFWTKFHSETTDTNLSECNGQ
jgi:hypothetical protein